MLLIHNGRKVISLYKNQKDTGVSWTSSYVLKARDRPKSNFYGESRIRMAIEFLTPELVYEAILNASMIFSPSGHAIHAVGIGKTVYH